MEKLQKDIDLVNIGLELFGAIGLHPSGKTWWGNALAVCGFVVRSWFLYLVVLHFVHHRGSPIAFIDMVEGITTLMQGYIRLSILILHYPNFKQLLQDMASFWPTCDTAENITGYSRWFRFFRFYKSMVRASLVAFFLRAVSNHVLVVICHIPDFPHAYWVLMLFIMLLFTWDSFWVTGIDINFLAMCFVAQQQFNAIEDRLIEIDQAYEANANDETLFIKMRECIIHHRFVLSFVEKLSKVYDISLLSQYFVTILALCIQLYGIAERGNVADLVLGFIFGFALLLQLALYCFSADDTTHIASNIGMSFYNMKWFEKSVKNQRLLPVVIQRTQRELKFKAGNMITINKEAFVVVFKSAFSFYTLLKRFKE